MFRVFRKICLRVHRNHFSSSAMLSKPSLLRLENGMCYRQVGEDSSKRIAVVTGWLNSGDRYLRPYVSFYNDNGIDTLSLSVNIKHILNPSYAMQQMKDVVREIESRSPDKVIFHQFSTGGYLYGQILRIVALSSENNKFKDSISAQIFDSVVDYESIPAGLSKSVRKGPIIEAIVYNTMKMYLWMVKDGAGVEHREASRVFHNNFVKAPSLWFYSKSDPVTPWEDCAKVVREWKDLKIDVDECVWDSSPHVSHGRFDPERYFGCLKSFLTKNKII